MSHRVAGARRLFETALRHRNLHLAPDDSLLESLARLVSFCADFSPSMTSPAPMKALPFTTKAATELAVTIRQQLHVDDASPLFELASLLPARLGTLVFPIRHSQVASACALFERRPVIFISTELGIEQLSACARELAHLIALSSRVADGTFANFTLRSESARRGPREYFAANFATELLVPTPGLGIALRKVRELLRVKNRALGDIEMLYMARIFGVSFSSIGRKCERAQLLPPGGAATMETFLTQKFGGAERRAEELGLPDRPSVHMPVVPLTMLPALERRIKSGGLSHSQAAEALNTSEDLLTLVLAQGENKLEGFWQ